MAMAVAMGMLPTSRNAASCPALRGIGHAIGGGSRTGARGRSGVVGPSILDRAGSRRLFFAGALMILDLTVRNMPNGGNCKLPIGFTHWKSRL